MNGLEEVGVPILVGLGKKSLWVIIMCGKKYNKEAFGE